MWPAGTSTRYDTTFDCQTRNHNALIYYGAFTAVQCPLQTSSKLAILTRILLIEVKGCFIVKFKTTTLFDGIRTFLSCDCAF